MLKLFKHFVSHFGILRYVWLSPTLEKLTLMYAETLTAMFEKLELHIAYGSSTQH